MLKRLQDEVIQGISYQFDVFIHVWSEDGGEKARATSTNHKNIDNIKKMFPFVRCVIVEQPYSDDFYEEFPSQYFEAGQSNPAAIMGMFIGVNRLINILRLTPIKYTHVLRLRTDMVLMSSTFYREISELLNDKVYVSRNYLIPYSWVSDHVLMSPYSDFLSLWGIRDFESFFKDYRKAKANPERYLGRVAKKMGIKRKIRVKWIRYRHYHILYDAGRKNEPIWTLRVNSDNVKDVFSNPCEFIDVSEKNDIECRLVSQKQNQDRYCRPVFIKFVARILRFTTEKND